MSRSTHDALLSSSCAVPKFTFHTRCSADTEFFQRTQWICSFASVCVDLLRICSCKTKRGTHSSHPILAVWSLTTAVSCRAVGELRLVFLACKFFKPRRPPMTPKSVREFRHNTSSATSSTSAAGLHHIRHPSNFLFVPLGSSLGSHVSRFPCSAVQGMVIMCHPHCPQFLFFLSFRHAR